MKSVDPFDAYPSLGGLEADLSEYEHLTTSDEPKDVLATPEEPRSLGSLIAMIGIVTAILGLRLIDLQIIEGTRNRVLAEGNRIRTREIRPPRGEIRDKNGIVVASNVVEYTLELYPAELPRKVAERETIFTSLEQVTGQNLTAVRAQIDQQGLTSLEPMTLIESVERDQALLWEVLLADLPGVSVTKLPRRQYAALLGLGHVLGYVGRLSEDDQARWPETSLAAYVGKSGLEYQYEADLQGTPGEDRIEVDAKGRVERTLAQLPPTPGKTLTLTLDTRLEESLMHRLREASQGFESNKAAAVVIDVHTGGILAMASLPSFDPNSFVRADQKDDRAALLTNPDLPLLNRAVLGTYPSGSTIKPVIAAAALSEGTITPKTTLDTSAGVIQIGQWRFPDWKVHGITDVRRALAESNDIFFYAVGGGYEHIPGLGVDRLHSWLDRFGFGKKTGIDLPSEAKGLVPDSAWKQDRLHEAWYIGDSYHLAIGQGFFLTTPLQLAAAIATIANNGLPVTPHLMETLKDPTGVTQVYQSPATSPAIVTPTVIATIQEGMRLTVTDGTARSLQELPVSVAGKTGTAQFGSTNQTHSWFVGFAPAQEPQIAFAFVVEGGGESSDTAVPAAKAFLADWVNLR